MSIFVLKMIACVTMFLDHIRYAIPETSNFLTIYGGRISFPIFAFLLTEGYIHTKNLKKYYLRLFVFALISQIPFMLFRTLVSDEILLNIMFTLLFGLMTITVHDKIKKEYISIPIIIGIICLSYFVPLDYGWYGVLTIFIMYLFKKNKMLLTIVFGILVAVYFYSRGILEQINLQVMIYYICNFAIPMICIWLYNGKLGRKVKYLFYGFYPVHMTVVYLISLIN